MDLQVCRNCRKIFVLRGDSKYSRRLPFLLACGHMLCSVCASNMGKRTHDVISCPECGRKTPYSSEKSPEDQLVPDLGTLGRMAAKHLNLRRTPSYNLLHTSFMWTRDKAQEESSRLSPPELGDVKASLETDTRCEECSKVAECKCVRCDGFYCNTCFEVVHAASTSLRRHTAIPAFQASSPPPSCTIHPSLSLSYYCVTEGIPLCADCSITTHKHHEVVPIGEAAESCREDFRKLIMNATTTLTVMKNKKQELGAYLNAVCRSSRQTAKTMGIQMRELYPLLQKRELTLQKEVSDTVQKQVAPLLEMEKTLFENISIATLNITAATELLKSDVKLLQDSDHLCEALRTQAEKKMVDIPSIPPISFTLSSSVKEAIEEAGVIQTDTSQLTDPVPEEASATNMPLAEIASKSLVTRNSLSPSPSPFLLSVEPQSVCSPSSPSPLTRARAQSYSPKKSSRESSLVSGSSFSRSRTASPVTVQLEETVEVWVSHVETPGEFFVQFKKEEDDLQMMSRELNELCSGDLHRGGKMGNIREGMKLAAKFVEDNMWYRAEVTSVHLSPPPSYVSVVYLDYGNSENIALNQLAMLPSSLANGPFYAYKCRLSGLQPPSRFSNVAPPSWSPNATTRFRNMVDGDNVVVKEHSHSPHGWREVEIFTVSPSDSSLRSISETLLQAGLAARAKRKEKATQLKIPSLPLPKPKDSMEVTMSSCVSPSDFYVQLASNKNVLEAMMTQIQEDVESLRKMIYCPYKGQVCLAKFTEDEKYYRAVVSDASDGTEIFVHYVDFGNEEGVREVLELPPELAILPAQALHCTLHNVLPKTGSAWPQEVSDKFMDYAFETELVMEPCRSGDPLPVLLTDKRTQQPLHCLLVVEDLARYASPPPVVAQHKKSKKKGKKKTKAPSVMPPTVTPPTPTAPSAHLAPLVPLSPLAVPIRGLPSPTKTTPTSSPAKAPAVSWPTTLPLVGEKLECIVVQVDSPGLFFLQPMTYISEVNSLLARVPPRQPSRQFWAVSECCLAIFNGEKWYRGQILEETGEQRYKVLYLDYGNTAVLPASELAIMPPALEKYAPQAVKATLAGVKPLNDHHTWSHETSLYFSTLVLEKHVTVTVQAIPSQSLPLTVSIATNGSSDVACILLSHNMALPNSPDYPMPDSSSSVSLIRSISPRGSTGPLCNGTTSTTGVDCLSLSSEVLPAGQVNNTPPPSSPPPPLTVARNGLDTPTSPNSSPPPTYQASPNAAELVKSHSTTPVTPNGYPVESPFQSPPSNPEP